MTFIERQYDLFLLENDYHLAHCISYDCAMGKGIALHFNKHFNQMKKDLLLTLTANNLKYPITIDYYDESSERHVFNLITKEKYWHKPTYEDISICIQELAWYCKENDIKKLAMPRIGCGLDRLKWENVKNILLNCFKELDIEIIICYL